MTELLPGYTRVTEIIGWFSGFRKCGSCGNNIQGIPQQVLDRKCEIGTNVHEMIESYIKGVSLPPPEGCVGYFESFKKWWELIKPNSQYTTEMRYYDNFWKLTGQIDLLLGNELYDFKTCSYMDPKSQSLQASFYWHLASQKEEMNTQVRFIQLQKSGNIAKVHYYPVSEDSRTLAFQHLKLYRHWNC